MITVRNARHKPSGTRSFRNGQMIRSGLASSAASTIASCETASSTLTS